MMNPIRRRYVLALILVTSFGCVGTDVGNPQTRTDDGGPDELRFTVDEESTTHAQALSYLGVSLDEAWLVVERVAVETCDTEVEYLTEGPFEIDLLAGNRHIQLPRGDETAYCRMKIDFSASKTPADGPEALVGAWFYASGTLEDGRPFTIRSLNRSSLNFVGPSQPIRFDDPNGTGFVTNLPFVRWLAEGNLAHLEDEELYLDDNTNAREYSNFKREFATQARLFRDYDKNGSVDDGDDDAVGIPE